ncbi:helix-turn-helix transcriptional regulator [Paenibacillus sp. ACRRX]|uniref:helix-turn-helix domain-containing protein n=1 Tax=Paenibacillus sp. ACRRX TaxID=2918206 RepID=UPI001EF74CE0|nr:helix-turn-helix transcriptional regulator [Paenibacillus sp. ACRRX]MCG7406735.1 helix-turn-helix transcriptional regulator [Paenibacillus sp. ACRRX]
MKLVLNVKKLERHMYEAGWDEKELAKRIGVTSTQVYRVIRGQRFPGNDFLAGLKTAGISLDEFTDVC